MIFLQGYNSNDPFCRCMQAKISRKNYMFVEVHSNGGHVHVMQYHVYVPWLLFQGPSDQLSVKIEERTNTEDFSVEEAIMIWRMQWHAGNNYRETNGFPRIFSYFFNFPESSRELHSRVGNGRPISIRQNWMQRHHRKAFPRIWLVGKEQGWQWKNAWRCTN